jgi:hypothetical protein
MYPSLPNKRLPAGLFSAVAASLLLSACFSTPANRKVTAEEPSTVAGGRPLVVQHTAADDRVVAYVWQQEGQYVRIESAEPGAVPHQQPVTLSAKQMKEALSQIRLNSANATPILTEEAIDRIAAPLAKALARATSDQEVTFAVTYRPHGFGILMGRKVTTGRMFRDDGGLQLIVGLLQASYEDEMLATGQRIAFTPGSRQHRIQQGWSLGTDKLVTHPVAGRDDWVRIDPMAWSASPVTASPVTASPVTERTAQPKPQRATQTEPATPANKYKQLEERLETLKRLRDKGLISEKAYEEKSRQILDEL